jgi:hypothetical protein
MEINQSDTLNTPLIVTNFKQWSDSANGICGKIHYTLSLVSGHPIPSFVQFQPQILSFVIFQTADLKTGIYQFKLVGDIKSQGLNDISVFNITIKNK